MFCQTIIEKNISIIYQLNIFLHFVNPDLNKKSHFPNLEQVYIGEKGFCVCAMCYTCAMASELCNVCCTVLFRVCVCLCCTHGVRASLAPSWFFVGRRTFTSGSGGGHGGTQRDLHTQTDR